MSAELFSNKVLRISTLASPDNTSADPLLFVKFDKFTCKRCPFQRTTPSGPVLLNNTGPLGVVLWKGHRLQVNLSNFTNNKGSALVLSGDASVDIRNTLFENNSADNGGAIMIISHYYFVFDFKTVTFIGNTAENNGGAIYFELYPHFSAWYNTTFVNNLAGNMGNNIYSNSYIPSITSKTLSYYNSLPPIFISPYRICLDSPSASCDYATNCNTDGMLGREIKFEATVCDYYGRKISGSLQPRIDCSNCTNYTPSITPVILGNRTKEQIIIFRHANDIDDDCKDCTYRFSFTITPLNDQKEFTHINTTLTVELSSCFSGFVFNNASQICECYNSKDDIIRCDKDIAEIRQGYWFGSVSENRTVSLCPNYYCSFSHPTETRNGYYNLPRKLDDQCRPHRTGVACGDCSSGYTLAYNAPDCVDERKCSWMLPMVIVLTILYWIIIVVCVCVVLCIPNFKYLWDICMG